MAVALSEPPILAFLNNAGQLNAGGHLLTQVGGVNYPTYQDSIGATPLPNPIPLNSRGEISNSSGVSCQLFLLSGVTYTFTLYDASGNQIWTAEDVMALAPVAVGNMTDEKGGDGNFGFLAGTDFTPGTSPTLTLSQNYGSAENLWISFDAADQGAGTFALSGTNNETLTFNAPIPIGTTRVFVKGGTSLTIGTPANGTVTDASVAAGTKLYNRINDTVDVRDPPFNAKWNGIADDTAALQAAVNSFSGQPGTVLLPIGTGNISSTVTLPPGVSIRGMGSLSTTITPKTAGMTIFQQIFSTNSGSNQRLSDFNINCGSVANVIGMNFVYCNRMDLENVFFFGCQYNFKYDRGGLNKVLNCLSASTATLPAGQILMWSSTDTEYGFVFSVLENYMIEGGTLGCQSPAVYFRRAVAVKANIITNNSNYTGYGLIIENDCQGIEIHDSIFTAFGTSIALQTGSGINVPPTFNSFNFVDCDQCENNHVVIANGVNNTFVGGMWTSSNIGTTGTALLLEGQNSSGNIFDSVTISGYNGIGGTGVEIINTNNNAFNNIKVENSTTGFAFGDTNSVNTRVIDCDFSQSVGTAIYGAVANTGNQISNCKGYYGSAAISSPAMISSGATITNAYGVSARVFITGGSVTQISINGVAAGFTEGMLTLLVGDTLSLTYTGSPTWNWIGM